MKTFREFTEAVEPLQMDRKAVAKAMKKVNGVLADMGKKYHDGLPITEISDLLTSNGFDATELEGIYTGREGRAHDPVGFGKYITLSWYKMPSGRYEVTAYVS